MTGDNGLNQGIWTVMSYIATDDPSSAHTNHTGTDRWFDSGGNDVANYGYFAGPMAYDIAAIQDSYGANGNFHNGSDTYWLPDQNALGTYWTCIWEHRRQRQHRLRRQPQCDHQPHRGHA